MLLQPNFPSKNSPHDSSDPCVQSPPSYSSPARPLRPSSHLFKKWRLICVLVLLLSQTATAQKPIKLLGQYKRRCFDVLPCIFFSNDQHSFGCAQCQDTREATMIEYVSFQELNIFTSSTEKRVVMIPEFLFFADGVMPILVTANNIEALIVYEGDSPNNILENPPNETLPFPPVDSLSVDHVEPNLRNNYYPSKSDSIYLEDLSTPLQDFKYKRNPKGNGLKFRVFPYSIYHVTEHTASIIRNSSIRFSDVEDVGDQPGSSRNRTSTSPQYKLQSMGQMFACPPESTSAPNADEPVEPVDNSLANRLASVTASTCLQNGQCLPIGGQSLWSALGRLRPQDHSEKGIPKILAITAPMDSMAFFPDLALGASAEISSLAVMLAVAKAVDVYRQNKSLTKIEEWQPVYFAWNAQSWGYAGSSRFLNDVQNFKCKSHQKGDAGCGDPFVASLKFQDFKNASYSVLNLGQLISPNVNSKAERKFYFHKYEEEANATNKSVILNALRAAFESRASKLGNGILFEEVSSKLLPADASQSFFRYERDADVISLTNYKDAYTNVYYHSMYDNETLTIADSHEMRDPLYQIAGIIAETVISLAYGITDDIITADSDLIDNVITCMTSNWTKCLLANEYIGDRSSESGEQVVAGNYAGSFFPSTRLRDSHPSWTMKIAFIRSILSYHNRYSLEPESDEELQNCSKAKLCDLKDTVNNKSQNASDLHTVFCSKGKCILSDTYMHDAFGTGLDGVGTTRTNFSVNLKKDTFSVNNPPEGAWVESLWDANLGLCGFVEDTPLYGWLILASGIAVLVVCFIFTLWFDRVMFRVVRPDEEVPLTGSVPELPTSP